MNVFRFDAHVIPWVKFLAMFVFSNIGKAHNARNKGGKTMHSNRQRLLMVLIGVLDSLAYIVFCIGFSYCGAATSSIVLSAASQSFTAMSSRLILKKRLSRQKFIAVAVVLCGVFMKAYSEKLGIWLDASGLMSRMGIFYTSLSGFLYSMVGVVYESLLTNRGKDKTPPSHSDIMYSSSVIGTVLGGIYQVLYVLPRWDVLVATPLAESGVAPVVVLLLLLTFGASYNMHMYAQSLVFTSDGALGVGLVNAVRGSVINMSASIAFCAPGMPWLTCLPPLSMASGLMTTTGGVLWVTSKDIDVEKKENSKKNK